MSFFFVFLRIFVRKVYNVLTFFISLHSKTKTRVMMKKEIIAILWLLVSLTACEKSLSEDVRDEAGLSADANVVLHLNHYEIEGFDVSRSVGQQMTPKTMTRATGDITTFCTRLNVAVFSSDGTKVKTAAQKEGDEGFGTVGLTLATGTYRLVVMAHSCDGSATITSEDRVSFPNNKMTDTFYYYGDLVVSEKRQTLDLTLRRAVAMFRLELTDTSTPSSVARLRFYYTGGSSTFSPRDGYGCVKSKQTEFRPVSEDGVYEIYTFPHSEEDVLTKLVITTLDADDNALTEHELENIPIVRNRVTRYTGSLFGTGGESTGTIGNNDVRVSADPDWAGTDTYVF